MHFLLLSGIRVRLWQFIIRTVYPEGNYLVATYFLWKNTCCVYLLRKKKKNVIDKIKKN